jgi:hypothetical protein
MSNHYSTDNEIEQDPYKDRTCIARFCTKEGIHSLKILFFNKVGLCCEVHKDEFLSLGLVEAVNQEKEISSHG